jgi:hypothetical protein
MRPKFAVILEAANLVEVKGHVSYFDDNIALKLDHASSGKKFR